jgi:hypothetical protein
VVPSSAAFFSSFSDPWPSSQVISPNDTQEAPPVLTVSTSGIRALVASGSCATTTGGRRHHCRRLSGLLLSRGFPSCSGCSLVTQVFPTLVRALVPSSPSKHQGWTWSRGATSHGVASTGREDQNSREVSLLALYFLGAQLLILTPVALIFIAGDGGGTRGFDC